MSSLRPVTGSTLRELPKDYDLDHLRAALSYVENFTTAVDGGAHQGIWSRELLNHFNRVYAFEPQVDNFNKLIFLNNRVNFSAYFFALGDKQKKRFMAPGEKNTGQYHVVDVGENLISVEPLDSFGLRDVGFIKLDVEGYELFALKGAIRTIKRDKPVILLEDNGLCERYGVKSGEAGKYVESLGYELVEQMDYDYVYRHSS